MSIGNNISRLRKDRDMTQMVLAEKIGVSFQAVSSWERDEYYPETENVLRLSEIFNVGPGEILETGDLPKPAVRDRLFDEGHMYTFIKSWAVANRMDQTLKALPLAKEKHAGQFRKGNAGIPYINHPLTLCCNAIALDVQNDDITAACLLHDVVEDCCMSVDELPVGDAAREIVRLLTKNKVPGKAFDEEAYYERIAKSPEASLVKLLDRCNNISNMAMGFSRDKMISYIQETEKYVMPLIGVIKETTEWNNAAWLISYQMMAVLETIKRLT